MTHHLQFVPTCDTPAAWQVSALTQLLQQPCRMFKYNMRCTIVQRHKALVSTGATSLDKLTCNTQVVSKKHASGSCNDASHDDLGGDASLIVAGSGSSGTCRWSKTGKRPCLWKGTSEPQCLWRRIQICASPTWVQSGGSAGGIVAFCGTGRAILI